MATALRSFCEDGRPVQEILDLAPKGNRRMGSNPHANGGLLLRDLRLPDFRSYAIEVPRPGAVEGSDMMNLGGYVKDIFKLNRRPRISGSSGGRNHVKQAGAGL